jgi:IS1 family transposase
MNKLSSSDRVKIVACLVEGNSIRATSRMTGIARNTVDKLLCELGVACSEFQDKTLRDLPCKRLQCDEIWSFVGCKEKNVPKQEKQQGRGDVWTWIAIDAETKLVPCWYVGNRDGDAAYHFMHDLAGRLANRVQLTTDAHRPYLEAVEDAFGSQIDYAQLVKIYGTPEASKYNPDVSRRLHGRSQGPRYRSACLRARLHFDLRASESHHADGDAPVHPPDECLFKEGR